MPRFFWWAALLALGAMQPAQGQGFFGGGLIWAPDAQGLIHRYQRHDTTGALYERIENGPSLAWNGVSPSYPAAEYLAPHLWVARRASDNTLWTRRLVSGQWETWVGQGGNLASSPFPIAFKGALHIFGLDAGRNVVRWSESDGQWHAHPDARQSAEAPYLFIDGGAMKIWATGTDGLSTWESASQDGVAFTPWVSISPGPRTSFQAFVNRKGPFTVHNFSGSSDVHALHLLARAEAALGVENHADKPRQMGLADAGDRFFVGRRYAAWLDQTGFFGEPNGLWRLNGRSDVGLDFLVGAAGEPLNTFVVGEMHDGAFSPGYSGSEHNEVPNPVPEPDDGNCGTWCAQYSLDEAGDVTDSDVPWWSSCNRGDAPWTQLNVPISEQAIAGGYRLVWESRLVKEADFGNAGTNCHQDWLFQDKTRHPVYLRVGLELFGDQAYFHRTFQYRNPAGNPSFTTQGWGIIGGVVAGAFPEKRWEHNLRYWKPLGGAAWNRHTANSPLDTLIHAPATLSATNADAMGYSITVENITATDNTDVSECYCIVHGGIEIGGGDLHLGTRTPALPAGQLSIESKRRFTLGTGPIPPAWVTALEKPGMAFPVRPKSGFRRQAGGAAVLQALPTLFIDARGKTLKLDLRGF